MRRLSRWMARTNISLPVPLSPVSSTVPSVGATRRARREDPLHGPAFADDPLEPLADFQFLPQGHVLADQRRVFQPLATTIRNWSGENGLLM